jgi:hypothetical protein
MKSVLHNVNLRNLRIWSSVGADIDNGLWAMYGTRAGWAAMCNPEFDYTSIRDYDWFNAFWAETQKVVDTEDKLLSEIKRLGDVIKSETKIAVPFLDKDQSEFFRETFKLRND